VIPLDAASEAGPDGSRLAYGREPPLSASRRVFLDRIFASVGAFRRSIPAINARACARESMAVFLGFPPVSALAASTP